MVFFTVTLGFSGWTCPGITLSPIAEDPGSCFTNTSEAALPD